MTRFSYMKCHKNEDAYIKLLQLFGRIVHANKEKPIPNDDKYLFDAEGLAIKFFSHALSFLHLSRGTVIPELDVACVDPASANVIARAMLETFLVFHDLYVNPRTGQEKDLRYSAWRLYGLLERSRSPELSVEARKIILESRQDAEVVRHRIKLNPAFCALETDRQKKILKGREWRLHTWRKIALSAGLSEIFANTLYKFLCGYAHAGNISVMQLHQAQTVSDQKALCGATFSMLIVSIANMIDSYLKIFPDLQHILESDPESVALVDLWIRMGSLSIAAGDI